MKITAKSKSRMILLPLAGALLFSSCGELRSRDDVIVTYGNADAIQSETRPDRERFMENLLDLIQMLYPDARGLPLRTAQDFYELHRETLDRLTRGLPLRFNEILSLMANLDEAFGNGDGALTFREGRIALETLIPSLRWIKNDEKLNRDQLTQRISEDQAETSAESIDRLVTLLMDEDAEISGGNADGLLNRDEISNIHLLTMVADRTDFSWIRRETIHRSADKEQIYNLLNRADRVVFEDQLEEAGIASFIRDPQSGAMRINIAAALPQHIQWIEERLQTETYDNLKLQRFIFRTKLSKLIFKNSFSEDRPLLIHELNEETFKIEMMSLIIIAGKYDHAVNNAGDQIDREHWDAFAPRVRLFGAEESPSWDIARFYDSAVAGGDGNGKLNALEIFNLATDLHYAKKITIKFGGELGVIRAHPGVFKAQDSYLIDHFKELYPYTGPYVALEPKRGDASTGRFKRRRNYWRGLRRYDRRDRGGNFDRRVNMQELTRAFWSLSLSEYVFTLYDRDRNGKINRAELQPLVESMGITDSRAVRAFFNRFDPIATILDQGPRELWAWPFYEHLEIALDQGL